MTIGAIAVAILFALLIGAFSGSLFQKSKFARDAQEINYYRQTNLRKQGWTTGFGTYELRSFDGGKQWYAIERNKDGAFVIRGIAEEVFPGLLAHLHAMDTLVQYAKENGPVTLSGPRAETDKKLLEAAGFTISHK